MKKRNWPKFYCINRNKRGKLPMYCNVEKDVAELAVQFLTSGDDVESVNAVNEILRVAGIATVAKHIDDDWVWIGGTDEDVEQANELLAEIIDCVSMDKMEVMLCDDDRTIDLLNMYDQIIYNYKQRRETLGWLAEFPD